MEEVETMVKISFPLKGARCAECGAAFEDGMTILGHGGDPEKFFCFECQGNDFINTMRHKSADYLDYLIYMAHDGSAFLSVDSDAITLLETGIYELEHFRKHAYDGPLAVRKIGDDEDVKEIFSEIAKKNFLLEKYEDYIYLFFPEKLVADEFDFLKKREDYARIIKSFTWWTRGGQITYLCDNKNRVVGITNGPTYGCYGLIRSEAFDYNVWGYTLQEIEAEYKTYTSLNIIKNPDDFSRMEDGIHEMSYSKRRDFFSYEMQLRVDGDVRKRAIKAMTSFFLVEKGSSFSCIFFERSFVWPKRIFISELNYTNPYVDEYYVEDYCDNWNYFRHFLEHFCEWTDSKKTDVCALVHEKNGHVVGFVTKDGVLADSAIARECYSGSLIKKSINELEKECGDDETEHEVEEEEDIVADIERNAKWDEEAEREKTSILLRFDFWSKICDVCDKPFKSSDFIVKIEGERENYCPKCARSKLLAVNDREKHARYQEYICENVYTWTLAHLVMDKRAFSELDNGLYGLKYHKSYDMKNSKMLYGRRKYIYEIVEDFAMNTISNCILEKSDDFTCLFFDQFISEKEEYFVEPEGKLKDMMDYLSEWTGKDVELIVDRNGYVRGFICGSETCDESLILKEYYSGRFTVKMVGYLD